MNIWLKGDLLYIRSHDVIAITRVLLRYKGEIVVECCKPDIIMGMVHKEYLAYGRKMLKMYAITLESDKRVELLENMQLIKNRSFSAMRGADVRFVFSGDCPVRVNLGQKEVKAYDWPVGDYHQWQPCLLSYSHGKLKRN